MDLPQFTVTAIFPYYALPHPGMWRSELLRLRLLGCQAVVIPIPWAYHSPGQGYHDFSDIRNLSLLLDEVEQVGLWVIPFVGPWQDAALSGRGIPAWVWRANLAECTNTGYKEVFLRHLDEWWQHLGALLKTRSHVLGTILNPSWSILPDDAEKVLTQVIVLAQNAGFTMPYGLWQREGIVGSVNWLLKDAYTTYATWTVARVNSPHASQDNDRDDLLADLAHAASVERGGVILDGILPESHWGWWFNALQNETAQSVHDDFLLLRQQCMQTEIALPTLQNGHLLTQATAIGPGVMVQAWTTDSGTGIYVRNRRDRQLYPRLVIPKDGATLVTEEVSLDPSSSKVLFADMRLRGGKLIYSTLEAVLRTEVAGRELLVFHNALGGEVRLSDDFRVRYRKGEVYTERLVSDDGKQLSIRFDPAKISSVLLDSPDGPLQLLAVNSHLARRLWHLDDTWRKVELQSSPWALKPDDPARGIVLGPEYVVPDDSGGFRYLVRDQGYGYRWGPWKGSDPNTWLAPLIWRSPSPVRLPELTWSSLPGAPEVLSGYDDQLWRTAPPDADLSMENLGIDAGFVWYRGHFQGNSAYVDLSCHHAADVFLNGKHIVSLNPPPDLAPMTNKRVAVAGNLMREDNVLVILTEAFGRTVSGDNMQRHGLVSCRLDAGQRIVWSYRPGLKGERQKQGITGYVDWSLLDDQQAGDKVITWHQSRFQLNISPQIETSIYLELTDVPVKMYVYLNGLLIHRTMLKSVKTQRIALPDALLHLQGSNELLVAQWTRGAQPGIGSARLVVGEIFGWQQS